MVEKIEKEFPDKKISQQFLSMVLNGKRRPSWEIAKVLGELTDTEPSLWMEGEPEELKKVISDKAA
jgi:hypothetical protein